MTGIPNARCMASRLASRRVSGRKHSRLFGIRPPQTVTENSRFTDDTTVMTNPVSQTFAEPTNVTLKPSGTVSVPQLLCPPTGGPVMLYNADLVNVVYAGYRAEITAFNSTAIQPLTSVVMDGSKQLWGFNPNKTDVVVNVTPGGIQQSPSPVQIATQIALKGINVNINGIAVVSPSGDITGVGDDTAILNALALTPATPRVQLGPGDFYIQSNIFNQLTDFTDFGGCGYCTRIHLVNNDANQFGVAIGTKDKANCVNLQMFLYDGNKANQIANAWQTGILLQNSGPGTFFTDGFHQIDHVFVENTSGSSIVQTGRGGTQISNFSIFQAGAFGLNVHEDCEISNGTIGASGLDGILEQGASCQFTGVKSWFSGAALVTSRIAGATLINLTPPAGIPSYDGGGIAGLVYSLANNYGNNHVVKNISGAAVSNAGSGGIVAGGYYQDGARAGYSNIDGSNDRDVTAIFERNNNCGTNGGVPNGGFAGVDLSASNCTIRGQSMMTSGNVNQQAAAINLSASANDCDIALGFKGTLNDGSNMPPLTAGSNPVKCKLSFKAANGASYFNPAFGAAFTPDPFRSQVIEMILTANITIGFPALTGGTGNVTGYNAPAFVYPGQRLTLILTEDVAGGHTVTFNGVFAVANPANTLSGNTNCWEFVYSPNLGWVQVAYSNP